MYTLKHPNAQPSNILIVTEDEIGMSNHVFLLETALSLLFLRVVECQLYAEF